MNKQAEATKRKAVQLTKYVEETGRCTLVSELVDFVVNNYDKMVPHFVHDPVITLLSSSGYVYADRNGHVVGTELFGNPQTDKDCYHLDQIKDLDLEEWSYSHPDEEIEGEHDILDFGYWLKDGTYERPCYHWRVDLEEKTMSDIVGDFISARGVL